jgi:hypothetical protein
VDGLGVDATGRLALETSMGQVLMTAPVAFQSIGGRRVPVDVRYVLRGETSYGFEVGPDDRERELVIDPLLASTFLGGHNP